MAPTPAAPGLARALGVIVLVWFGLVGRKPVPLVWGGEPREVRTVVGGD